MQFPFSPNTNRIWLRGAFEVDSYADFFGTFDVSERETIVLKIACDSAYALWLNGNLVAFSGCGDYPWYKLYDIIDITDKCARHNELRIQVWYIGAPSQTYYVSEPGLMFEVVQEDKVLLASDKNILCRKNTAYKRDAFTQFIFSLE